MKYFYFLSLLLIESCVTEDKKDTTQNFDFLEGAWQRVNDEEGVSTYENWKVEKNTWQGIGCSVSYGDTVFYEVMNIAKLEESWRLQVAGPNETPVAFTITELGKNSFTATNPAHDFPKSIKYWLDSDTLKAEVSGEDMTIEFGFVRR